MAKQEPIRLILPLDREVVKTLKAGQACTLSGPLFTLRDAGHQRLLEEMASDNNLPYGLSDQTIFYAGPTPEAAGRPFGAIGPTTASTWILQHPILWIAGLLQRLARERAVRRYARPACETLACILLPWEAQLRILLSA